MLSLTLFKQLPGFTLDVSWSAAAEVVVLFGPSGAGKSVTLQCFAGLVHPDSGQIVVNGRAFYDSRRGIDLPPQARRLGYVFQGYALFPHLTVEENVAFGLHALPRSRRRARAGETLERLGLAGRYPRQLSGGQQQRVALGRALAVDPEVLLLDEPLSALDAPTRRQLRSDLMSVIRDWGKTAVLVTHDLAEAYQLADRLVIYQAGRVVQAAPKGEVLQRPATKAVARLMGIRNILSGTVVKATPDLIQLRWRGEILEAANSPTLAYAAPPGTPVAFCIRPEYIRLIRKDRSEPAPGTHPNLMRGELVGEEDQGPVQTLFFRLDAPGEPSQGPHDLEIDVPRQVHEILEIERDRRWAVFVNRGSIQLLPTV
jgi:molybdate transport system ATP-binding protein